MPASPVPEFLKPSHRLLIVTIDRLPAWMISACGAGWVSMPSVDRLASRGIVFDRCLVTSDDVQEVFRSLVCPAGESSIFEQVRRCGHESILVTDAQWLRDNPFKDTGFPKRTGMNPDEVRFVEGAIKNVVATHAESTHLFRIFDEACLAVNSGARHLVWCHVESLGVSWDAPLDYRFSYADPDDPAPKNNSVVDEMSVTNQTDPDQIVGIRQAFAGQLTLLDECLGRLMGKIESSSDQWTVLLCGVRGMALGLHGYVGTQWSRPFGELIHVPAILCDPQGRMSSQRFGGLTIPADLSTTVAGGAFGVADVSSSNPSSARSLDQLFTSWKYDARDRVVVTSMAGRTAAIVTPAWHLAAWCCDSSEKSAVHKIEDLTIQLFSKPDDFFELSDVADRCRDVTDELGALAVAVLNGSAESAWSALLSQKASEGFS